LLIFAIGLPHVLASRENRVGASLQLVPFHLLFVALLGVFLLVGSSRYRPIVQLKPLMFFGELSYGPYLYHLLLFYFFRLPSLHFKPFSMLVFRFLMVSTAASLVAFLSRRQLEDRFLALKDRLAPS